MTASSAAGVIASAWCATASKSPPAKANPRKPQPRARNLSRSQGLFETGRSSHHIFFIQIRVAGGHQTIDGGLDVGAQKIENSLVRQRTHETVNRLAILEEDNVGDRANRELCRELRIRIAVDLGENNGAIELFDDALELGAEHPTGSAPGGPEVDQNRDLA